MNELTIYPTNINNYCGSIYHRHQKWQFVCKKYSEYKTFDNLKDAVEYKKQFSIKKNKVNNVLLKFKTHYEMVLNKSITTKIDLLIWECLNVHLWRFYRGYAVTTLILNEGKSKIIRIEELIMSSKRNSIEHINGDDLDNRKENLKIIKPTKNNKRQRILIEEEEEEERQKLINKQ